MNLYELKMNLYDGNIWLIKSSECFRVATENGTNMVLLIPDKTDVDKQLVASISQICDAESEL